ncbi:MAG: hypothetical protein ACR2HR_17805 [Euzebya sp.]
MDDIKENLFRKAYLYTDGEAYRAGVEAALAAMLFASEDQRDEQPAVVALNR